MSHSSRGPDDEDLTALVSELETTLSDLRAELAERDRADDHDERAASARDRRSAAERWERRDRGRRPPRPPAPGELFRFTSDYTIPTVVAVLEATIEALELLRGVIDLAAPGETPARRRRGRGSRRTGRDARGLARSVFSDAVGEGVTAATDRAATDAADALERLRETLSEADLPEDGESRDLVADARELSAELERRVRESREVVDRERDRERRTDREPRTDSGRDDGPVTIEVGAPDDSASDSDDPTHGDDESHGGRNDSERDGDDARPEVDVDSELESIKREMRDRDDERERGADGAEDADDIDDNSVAGDASSDGGDADSDETDGSGDRN